jgi:hypothetical protein
MMWLLQEVTLEQPTSNKGDKTQLLQESRSSSRYMIHSRMQLLHLKAIKTARFSSSITLINSLTQERVNPQADLGSVQSTS